MAIQLVGVIVAIASLAEAEIEHLRNLNDLYDAAESLESARMQVSKNGEASEDKRIRRVYSFIRESKSLHCERHYSELTKTIEEYRAKAYNFLADSKKPTNWLSGIKKLIGPLSGMKNLAKFDKYLATITERYESQAGIGILSEADIDCDMVKFYIINLNAMMFVLQTDVKYLIFEEPQANNIAIFRNLAESKFIANTNFYGIDSLTESQRLLLLQMYASRVDQTKETIGDALEHFYEPGNLILGRLLDSCHKIKEYQATWLGLEPNRASICAKSRLDLSANSLVNQISLSNYSAIIEFCGEFLDSL